MINDVGCKTRNMIPLHNPSFGTQAEQYRDVQQWDSTGSTGSCPRKTSNIRITETIIISTDSYSKNMFSIIKSTLDSSLTSPQKQQTILWVRNSGKTIPGRRPFLLLLLLLLLLSSLSPAIVLEFWLLWTGRVSRLLFGRFTILLEARLVLFGRLEGVLLGKPVVVSVIVKRRYSFLGKMKMDLGKYDPIALDRELRCSRSRSSGYLSNVAKENSVL